MVLRMTILKFWLLIFTFFYPIIMDENTAKNVCGLRDIYFSFITYYNLAKGMPFFVEPQQTSRW